MPSDSDSLPADSVAPEALSEDMACSIARARIERDLTDRVDEIVGDVSVLGVPGRVTGGAVLALGALLLPSKRSSAASKHAASLFLGAGTRLMGRHVVRHVVSGGSLVQRNSGTSPDSSPVESQRKILFGETWVGTEERPAYPWASGAQDPDWVEPTSEPCEVDIQGFRFRFEPTEVVSDLSGRRCTRVSYLGDECRLVSEATAYPATQAEAYCAALQRSKLLRKGG